MKANTNVLCKEVITNWKCNWKCCTVEIGYKVSFCPKWLLHMMRIYSITNLHFFIRSILGLGYFITDFSLYSATFYPVSPEIHLFVYRDMNRLNAVLFAARKRNIHPYSVPCSIGGRELVKEEKRPLTVTGDGWWRCWDGGVTGGVLCIILHQSLNLM